MGSRHWSCRSLSARAYRSPTVAGISWEEVGRRITRRLPGLELMQDIWPSRDGISEESACSRFGGAADILTEITLLPHTRSAWVGAPSAHRWCDEDMEDLCVADGNRSRTTIEHSQSRAAKIHEYRSRILSKQSHKQGRGATNPSSQESFVSFRDVVDYVEPKLLHVRCRHKLFTCASVGSKVSLSANGEGAIPTCVNNDQHSRRAYLRCGFSRADHFDAAREGETKNCLSLPPSVRSFALSPVSRFSQRISCDHSMRSLARHVARCSSLLTSWLKPFSLSHFVDCHPVCC